MFAMMNIQKSDSMSPQNGGIPSPQGGGDNKAFTLVEMSVVLIVIGLVIMTVFPAMNALRQNMQHSATQANLTALMRATTAFVQAKGCVPCPTPASTMGPGFGHVRGDDSGTPCNNDTTKCVGEGVVPFISLGVPASTAKDGWGRWITMRVDPALTIVFGVTPTGTQGLCRAGLYTAATAKPINVAQEGGGEQHAAVIFVSHGANGLGAYRPDPAFGALSAHPTFGATCAAGNYERCNADGDQSFMEPPSIDDVLLYLGRDALVTYLGNTACQTVWAPS